MRATATRERWTELKIQAAVMVSEFVPVSPMSVALAFQPEVAACELPTVPAVPGPMA